MKLLEFTFGIITSNRTCQYLTDILESIQSIESLSNSNYQIVIVGGPIVPKTWEKNGNVYDFSNINIKQIPFDDSPKIALKKNLITKYSDKENIVFLHDYFSFDSQWYNGFLEFGNSWDICMNMLLNVDGSRFRDWVTWDAYNNQSINGKTCYLAPYSYDCFDNMYISGSYWVAKRKTMVNEPLNKWLQWGECEDLEWSKRVLRKKYSYKMNPLSVARIIKPYKDTVFKYME